MNHTTNCAARYMVQEMGIVSVILLLVSNSWLLIANMNTHNSEAERLKRIENNRFTSEDGLALRKMVETNKAELIKNRENVNQLRIEIFEKFESHSKGESP